MLDRHRRRAGPDAIAAPAPDLAWHEVERAVWNVRNNGPELAAAVG